jgi:hypothetical protein
VKTKRKNISKKTRFEVFKRDAFTCQYCGRKSPDVVLQIDHIKPVSKGGTNEILNLVTSCDECNSGKSNRELSDKESIKKQQKELEKLQEKKEQLEMLFDWKKELTEIDEYAIEKLADYWNDLSPGWELNENGMDDLRKYYKKYSVNEIIDAMNIAATQYFKYTKDFKITKETYEEAFQKIPGICQAKKTEKYNPYIQDMYYIRGILKNKLPHFNEKRMFAIMHDCVKSGVDILDMREASKSITSWQEWISLMNELKEEKDE